MYRCRSSFPAVCIRQKSYRHHSGTGTVLVPVPYLRHAWSFLLGDLRSFVVLINLTIIRQYCSSGGRWYFCPSRPQPPHAQHCRGTGGSLQGGGGGRLPRPDGRGGALSRSALVRQVDRRLPVQRRHGHLGAAQGEPSINQPLLVNQCTMNLIFEFIVQFDMLNTGTGPDLTCQSCLHFLPVSITGTGTGKK